MHRLLINLYELGQFLRILLWISVPMVIISMLVTTWLHYRRKRRHSEEWVPAMLLATGDEFSGTTGQEPHEEEPGYGSNGDTLQPEEKEHIYKGILWMKEKYEQYRDMADRRYEQLKEELNRTEKKYQELLESVRSGGVSTASASPAPAGAPASPISTADAPTAVDQASYPDLLEEKNRQIAFLQQQLDQRIKNYHQSELDGRENKNRMLQLEETQLRTRYMLEEKQAYIDQLEGQLVAERQKIEELVTKLQASSQQLLTIYEELDKSLKPAGLPDEPLNSPSGS